MKKKPMSISEARARFPELAKKVSARPGAVEYIEHRDLQGHLALTTASHIAYLEATIAELKKRLGTPFSLMASISSSHSDAEIEAALKTSREEQAREASSKLARTLG